MMDIMRFLANTNELLADFCEKAYIILMASCIIWLIYILVIRSIKRIINFFIWVNKKTFGPNNIPVFWNCSKKRYNEVNSLIAELPEKICYIFREKGFQLCMLNHNDYILNGGKFSWTVGLFDPFSKMIFVDVDRSVADVKDTLYHELGHFCDWLDGDCTFYRSDKEFGLQQIYQGYRNDTNIPEYYRSDVKEFVAYCVSNVVCNPSIITSQMQAIGRMFMEHAFMAADEISGNH